MLAFIVSVQHPETARSYARIGALLDRTLRSVCRQTCSDFVAIVVCNSKPTVTLSDPRVWFEEVRFPRPEPVSDPNDYADVRWDKGTKTAVGLLRARAFHPTHVMFLDSDDLVHRGLAAHVRQHPGADGWHFDRGYVYWEDSGRITPIRNFVQLCGTSHIIAFRLLDLPPALEPGASQSEIVAAAGDQFVRRILGSHRFTIDHFARLGHRLTPLPFPGAVWVRGTGENRSPNRGFPSLLGHRIGPEIELDFGLTPPRTSFWREALAAFGQSWWLEKIQARVLRGGQGQR